MKCLGVKNCKACDFKPCSSYEIIILVRILFIKHSSHQTVRCNESSNHGPRFGETLKRARNLLIRNPLITEPCHFSSKVCSLSHGCLSHESTIRVPIPMTATSQGWLLSEGFIFFQEILNELTYDAICYFSYDICNIVYSINSYII